MISYKLMFYCFAVSGIYMLVVSIILALAEVALKLTRGLPAELVESSNLAWFIMNFLMEFLFYVVIPTIIFSFFFVVIPLSGLKAGLAGAVLAFLLGSTPVLMGLSVKVKLPMPLVLFALLSHLIKLGGSMALIGYLYSL
ncbi:MAG: hypothetical protein PHU88_04720 [candidate division Zixibacteria bacterium]|nr:hypothetical protein [candidate division Zixibacteria bacterium]MDD5426814.1 hypothetical protein [candidate division Zixibacteria bacterium]